MTPGERKHILDSYGNAAAILRSALQGFPKKMWIYKASPDCWSIHECVLHLADSEANEYVWCRRFVVEPGSPGLTFDASTWANRLGYFHQNTREALQIFVGLRRLTHCLLTTLREHLWHTAFDYSRYGKISLERWLEIQERHIPDHIEEMKESYRRWLELNPPRKCPSVRGEARPMSDIPC